MRRSLASRIAALAIATLVGFASPALALAHGYAHHEASEHSEHAEHDGQDGQDGGHSGALVSEASDELHGGVPRSIQAAYESKDHAHPQLAHARPGRVGAPLFVLFSATPVAVPVGIVVVSIAALLPTAALARAGTAAAPPRQPRAPPLG